MRRHNGKIYTIILSGLILAVLNGPVTVNEAPFPAVTSSELLQVQSVFAPIADKGLTGRTLLEASLRCVWEYFPDIRDVNTPLTPEINGAKVKLNFERTKNFDPAGNLLVNCSVTPAGEKYSSLYKAAINPLDGGITLYSRPSSDLGPQEKTRDADFETMNMEGSIPSSLRIDGTLLKQMDEKDIEDITKIISGTQNELEKFIIAAEGRIIRRGRTVNIKLRKALQYHGRAITMMRLKGVCPLLDDSGNLTAPHRGDGYVGRRLDIDRNGDIFVKPGEENLGPEGTMFYRNAENEFMVMRDMGITEDVKTDIPVGIGRYDLTFNFKETGYVICGVEGEDIRITDSLKKSFAEIKNLILRNNVTGDDTDTLNKEEEAALFREIGRTFRTYHDKGYYHGYPHWGNIGVVKKDGVFEVILRDLDTTANASEKDTDRRRAGSRFLDISRVIYDLQVTRSVYTGDEYVNTNFSELVSPFLEGYFHGLDTSGPGFNGMLIKCMDEVWTGVSIGFAFSARRAQLVGTNMKGDSGIIDRENLSEENPYFGKMMALLYDIERSPDNKNIAGPYVPEVDEFKEALSSVETLSTRLAATTESILMTRPVILAFDGNIAGFQSASPMVIFEELRKLKKHEKFRKILKDLTILDSRSPEILIRKIREESRKYPDDKKPEIFIFSRVSEKEKFAGITSSARVHPAYINEKDLPSDHYYPLVEIVTITLSRFLDSGVYTPAVISKLLEELNVNLGPVEEDAIGGLIFTLIPNAGKYPKHELINRYAALKRFLESA
ncbi:MAG: hypothetical protein ABIA77_01800 [Candidatus Omnitrophota bacterium]